MQGESHAWHGAPRPAQAGEAVDPRGEPTVAMACF